MIKELIERWDSKQEAIKDILLEYIKTNRPSQDGMGSSFYNFSYESLYRILFAELFKKNESKPVPDLERLRVIDDGDYQGYLLFVCPEESYQPSKYYLTFVGYGSCTVCDTIQSIIDLSNENDILNDLLTLCLHMIQGTKILDAWEESMEFDTND